MIKSWITISPDSDFSIHNIPFGIFSIQGDQPRMGTAIGDQVLDISLLASKGLIDLEPSIAASSILNPFIALGKEKTNAIRQRLISLLSETNDELQKRADVDSFFHSQKDVQMHLPVQIGDYTDFYSSIQHATNVGIMFRDPANALLPNWKHIPVGYHGRASSIVVSGTDFHRPMGQIKPVETEPPIYAPSRRMDFELEVAFIVSKETSLGDTISTKDAEEYIFGLTLFNDLSARDIQQWEYVPLGPFLGKNFASIMSPWVVTMEALEEFRVSGEVQEPNVLPYLEFTGNKNYDINLEVSITTPNGDENIVCESNFKYMYWNMCQQLAHHTVNGCNVRVGDVMASGTISGSQPHEFGSMLELAWKGTKPLTMKDGTTRVFLNDLDRCTIKGYAQRGEVRVGFGECSTVVLPAKQ
jgi:fumarylacetoacetase